MKHVVYIYTCNFYVHSCVSIIVLYCIFVYFESGRQAQDLESFAEFSCGGTDFAASKPIIKVSVTVVELGKENSHKFLVVHKDPLHISTYPQHNVNQCGCDFKYHFPAMITRSLKI